MRFPVVQSDLENTAQVTNDPAAWYTGRMFEFKTGNQDLYLGAVTTVRQKSAMAWAGDNALHCNALNDKEVSMPPTLKDSQVSVRLPIELKGQMETYAQLTGRTKSYVAMEALTEYLAWRIPQVADLREAVAAAERGEFATDEEMNATFAKYVASKPVRGRGRPAGSRGKR